jgi:hypothetical protein
MTGSSTYRVSSCARIAVATVPTSARVASMPLLHAAGRRSDTTAAIWPATMSSGIACTALTPSVFCTVIAVTADVPNTPNAWNVFRSAWMPAPPPLSLPAMVSATGTVPDATVMGRT